MESAAQVGARLAQAAGLLPVDGLLGCQLCGTIVRKTMTTQAEAKRSLELPALVALALAGAAIGIGVVWLGSFGPTRFAGSGPFRLWQFMIAAQSALWAIAAAAFLILANQKILERAWPDARRTVVAYVVAAAIPLYGSVAIVALRADVNNPLADHRWKLPSLYTVGTTVALIGVAVLALIKGCLQDGGAGGTAADIARYIDLRRLLQRVLTIEGAILATAVLAAGALRNAVVAFTHHQSDYPRELVLIVGAYYTLILALLYAPVYAKLLQVGRANLNAACPLVEPASTEWLAAYEKREKLGQYLQLEVTAGSSFQAGIAILAPLASALVALLLGTH